MPVSETINQLGLKARLAAHTVAIADTEVKDAAIRAAADALISSRSEILSANELDLTAGQSNGLSDAMLDRLLLNEDRVAAMATGLKQIAELDDPVGRIIANWTRPNGLNIERVLTPLGVIGVIYESRPNVTADAGALCLKAGNTVILRGGSDAIHSSRAIHQSLVAGLHQAGLPEDAIQLVQTTDRAAVGQMLAGLNGNLDVIVPRGGKGLVQRVQTESRVPVFAHLEGICHVYVDAAADLNMAVEVVANSKMRRPGICGAAETLLIHQDCLETHLAPVLSRLDKLGCEIRGDQRVCAANSIASRASELDWSTEYLAAIISVRVVDSLDQAIEHIARYSSGHTESIVTSDQDAAKQFLQQVDSAIVLHNASTQFADGGEFGMGAEIGIATGRFHARGPVGVDQLTTFKYRVHGTGQVRE